MSVKEINKGVTSFYAYPLQKNWIEYQATVFGLTKSEFIRCRIFKGNCEDYWKIPESRREEFDNLLYPNP